MPTVRQATIDLLRTHGLTTWFGNPGSSELTLLEDFPSDFRYMLGLQEMVPVGMADAYAQITGRPAIVNLHTAPGMGNAQGALYNAYINKTPLIVTAGNQRREHAEPDVPADQRRRNERAQAIREVVCRTGHRQRSPRSAGPRHPHRQHRTEGARCSSHFPWTTWRLNSPTRKSSDIDVVRTRTVTHAGGFPDEIADRHRQRASTTLNLPRIIVGGDVERFGAWDAVIALAERTQSIVLTAPLTGLSGFPENHPLYHGSLPPGAGWISKALTGRDLVVVIGAPVFRYYPQDRRARTCPRAPA